MPWTHDFHISHDNRIVHLNPLSSSTTATGVAKHKACNRALQSIVDTAIHLDLFPILGGRHSEPYPILGTSPLLKIERFVANLFGIVQRGAHLTAYTYVPSPSADVSSPSSDSSTSTGKGDLKIYIPTRSPQNFTFPLLYDSTVAGGISATESALSCIVREAAEEASLPSSYVREHAKPTGCLSYIYVDDGRHDSIAWRSDSGMPTQEMRGLVQPNILYTYDLLLPSDGSIAPTKNSLDDEVHSFSLLSVEEVLRALLERRFKPNCALVMIDFFVRHGLITPENEKHYSEIVARVHRRMPFATYVGQEFTE
jgi:8-oxo-dGTP pyrophosphatase MutT (NUDIX family)